MVNDDSPNDSDDDETTALVKNPLHDSRVYPLETDDSPRCGINYRHGEWVTVPVEDVPDDLDGCQRCPKASAKVDNSEPSLLKQARHGTPEDFGLPPF